MTSQIICKDAIDWLKKQPNESLESIVTGIPDLDEIENLQTKEINKNQYIQFFQKIVKLLFQKTDPNGYIILLQTDRKLNGEWIDKSFLANQIAHEMNISLMWHKIIMNREGIHLQRPTYSHMLCFSKKGTSGKAFPDLLTSGQKFYKNATSPNATAYCMQFLKLKQINSIIDPFVGKGTIPIIANYFKINCIGIDIDPKQCKEATENLSNDKIIKLLKTCDFFMR